MKKLVLLMLLFGIAFSFAGELIVANGGPATISSEDIKNIYLNKKKSFDNGTPIVLGVLKSGAAHEGFLATYVKKQPMQFNNFWKQQVFTGAGKMPKAFASENDMLNFISATPGAVGYVSDAKAGSLPANVNQVTIK